jgi:hypothetical protein
MPAVKSKLVLLNYEREWLKYIKNGTKWQPNGSHTVKGNVLLRLSENLIDHFKIPVYSGALPGPSTPKLTDVKQTSVTRHLTIDGSKKLVVNRRAHQRLSARRKGRKKTKPIRVPLGDKKTATGNQRFVTIPFPVWFNIPMIMQALGTMLAAAAADRKPESFISEGGSSYRIPYNVTPGAAPTGWKDGAWLASTLVAGVNIDDPNDPFSSPIIEVSGSSGDHDGATPPV